MTHIWTVTQEDAKLHASNVTVRFVRFGEDNTEFMVRRVQWGENSFSYSVYEPEETMMGCHSCVTHTPDGRLWGSIESYWPRNSEHPLATWQTPYSDGHESNRKAWEYTVQQYQYVRSDIANYIKKVAFHADFCETVED